jgi:hypothetical protein
MSKCVCGKVGRFEAVERRTPSGNPLAKGRHVVSSEEGKKGQNVAWRGKKMRGVLIKTKEELARLEGMVGRVRELEMVLLSVARKWDKSPSAEAGYCGEG